MVFFLDAVASPAPSAGSDSLTLSQKFLCGKILSANKIKLMLLWQPYHTSCNLRGEKVWEGGRKRSSIPAKNSHRRCRHVIWARFDSYLAEREKRESWETGSRVEISDRKTSDTRRDVRSGREIVSNLNYMKADIWFHSYPALRVWDGDKWEPIQLECVLPWKDS